MKKLTVRFAAVGTVLLLGAVAMALAQHDARQRPHESLGPAKPASESPQPILVDNVQPTWLDPSNLPTVDASAAGGEPLSGGTRSRQSGLSEDSLVRANDDRDDAAPPSLAYAPEQAAEANPLRPLAALRSSYQPAEPLGSIADTSAVTQAAGEGPPNLAALPELPSLGAAPLAAAPLAAPQLPKPSSTAAPLASGLPGAGPAASEPSSSALPVAKLPAASATTPGLPSAGLPSENLPAASLPNVGLSSGGLPVADLSSEAAGGSTMPASGAHSAPPGWVNAGPIGAKPSARGSLSDTQRPAMPTTDLSAAAAGSGQAWLQAPPASGGGGSSSAGQPRGTGGNALAGDSSKPGTAEPFPPSATLGTPQPPRLPSGASASLSGAPGGLPTSTGGLPPSSPNMPSIAAGEPSPQSRGPLASGKGGKSLLAGSALGMLVSNQPGNRHLDGSQNPIMLIQKRMAGECQVGKRTTVVITVRNAGNSTAQDVEVIDSVPGGAVFAESIPAVTPTPEGVLVWQLGEMAPGDERTINLQIVPERQGELGSTAVVRFAAQASVRTLATLPKLELTQSCAPEVLIGSAHAIDVVVKNVGTGVARGVRLEADLPANLRHESGDASLEASFGELAPNESKHIRLDAIAVEPGQGVCAIRALTEDGVQQTQKAELRVLAPALEASIAGPSKRYLDRQATFEIMIKNTGTASATNCEFVVHLPAGLNFNTANKAGTYDPKQHAVFWSVPEFPAGHAEPVELTVLPVEVGTQAMTFQGTADLGVKTEARGALSVEEQGELAFRIEQDADPIEVTASTTYTIEVTNVGRADHNVQLSLQLPAGSRALKIDAPVKYSIVGDQLVFEPIPEMGSRAAQRFRVEVGNLPVGTQIVRAQLKSQNRPTAVIKEEATDVYDDRK